MINNLYEKETPLKKVFKQTENFAKLNTKFYHFTVTFQKFSVDAS